MIQHRTGGRSSSGQRADTYGTSTMDLSGRCVGSSYVLQRPIGQGATGTVWEALDQKAGKPVAVKLLHESLLRQPKLVTRFVQERTILRMLRHRNVVRVHDLFSVGETIGLVMDLVSGGSLRDLLRERPTVAPGEAARLTAQVAAALAEAHDLGVVHRDLKPDNILLATADGRLDTRLTDFGVARILNTPSMTTPNAVVGTPHYMSPEAFHGSTASPATDVYALGVLLYELISGRPPYTSDSIPDLMRQHLEGNPERRPGLPDLLWDVIMGCMAQKPRLRPTAAELVADLSDAARRFADVPALPPPDEAPSPPQSVRSPFLQPASSLLPGRSLFTGPSLVPAPAPSLVPGPRRPEKRNAVPSWRWGRPLATLSLVAAAMVASAVATTAWNLGRPDGETRDLGAPPQVVASSAPAPVAATGVATGATASAVPRRPAAKDPGRSLTGDAQPLTPTAPAARPSDVRPKAVPAATKHAPTRSPQPEARPYGPWECRQGVTLDWSSKTAMVSKPCHTTGRDVRYQGSLTAQGGGRGSITVALKDVTTGRTVGPAKTCDGLTFEGKASTRECGPGDTSPARGREYAVVMSFTYEREGRTLTGRAQGAAFTW
ncbi:serine/threonine-protein kinase [Actinoplanes solisilvae]|uniref:serine/threonine-protein kinase n=1 Tax=Actinoplanes solisilvae TaxID=2486853 RepID=UPI001F0C6650|nr:serine/threonine-protein kinase [Actinoplanes solisilvae]